MPLSPNELAQAAAIVAYYMQEAGTDHSISGGAAGSLLRQQYNLTTRTTDDIIDLVIQPSGNTNAETLSEWLYTTYPEAFGKKVVYGVTFPTLKFTKSNGSRVAVDLEIFDVQAWPMRPQYDLSDPDNERTTVSVDGTSVIIFGPRWMLREKIVTAYERHGSNKERNDINDVAQLLMLVDDRSVNLANRPETVDHILTRRPDLRERLQLKISCPAVLGGPWIWDEDAGVYHRLEGGIPWYLDENLSRHQALWDDEGNVYYLQDTNGASFWFDTNGALNRWTWAFHSYMYRRHA